MGLWEDRVLPRLIDFGMDNRTLRRERSAALAEAKGRVLEVGFGSGLNLPHYPEPVRSLTAVEPADRARDLAARRIRAAPFPVEVLGVDGEHIPCPDEAFDTAVSTFSLCTIPDAAAALGQLYRALAPGGRLLFLEHGVSEDEGVRRWQDRLNPAQRCLFGGCNLNRDIPALVAGAGFVIERVERYYSKGPKPLAFFYRGAAVKPA